LKEALNNNAAEVEPFSVVVHTDVGQLTIE